MELELSQLISSQKSSNLVSTIEAFEDDEFYYLVNELMQGGDLFDYVCEQQDQPLEEEHGREIVKSVALGLSVLHNLNIVHRDIKIDNVLVSSILRGQATFKLADFGSSVQLASERDTASEYTGTKGYMSPEILRGQDYNKAVDIYSLGALMHALMTA